MDVDQAPPDKWFPEHRKSEWFQEHFEEAASEVVTFAGADNISLTGKRVADIGCGDGMLALGVAQKSRPAHLVGFDTRPTDVSLLRQISSQEGAGDELPQCLEFRTSKETKLPADDGAFDFVYSWSAFEHVGDPAGLIKDVRRVLVPEGQFMIQIYPFYHSEHGSHLWEWYPTPNSFAQFLKTPEEMYATVRKDPGPDPEWAEACLWAYTTLNKITLDDLQRALYAGGFRVARLDLITEGVHIPAELAPLPLSLVGIAGVKLLAVPN